MKGKIILVIFLCITAILSYQITSFEFVLIAFIVLSLIFLILAGIRNFIKPIKSSYFRVPGIIIIICFTGVLVSLLRPYEKAILKNGSVTEKLEYAYATDQNDRKQLRSYIYFLSEMASRDKARIDQVNELYQQESIVEAMDKFHAAFVFHHSNKSEDYKIASELSAAAAQDPGLQDHYQVQWLSKAAYDRYMLSIGKEEKYNTQNKFSLELE